jgi:diacylglycerol O-acyltransferase
MAYRADRMSPLDASFWTLEDTEVAHQSLHIASFSVFAGPAPAQAEIRDLFERKLPLVPRYRQRMRPVRFGLARPAWVDDETFDLDYHLRRTALPAPGGEHELRALIERVMSTHLDRERPLWEAWIVEGLSGGNWGLISKLHHSMVDGIAGVGVLGRIMDTTPDAPLPELTTWLPRPEPSELGLLGMALRDRAGAAARMVRGASVAAVSPRRTVPTVLTAARGMFGYATAVRPVRRSSLVGGLGAARRYRWSVVDLADISAVRAAFGGSPNDVVLAIVTRGFRDLLEARGEELDPRAVHALVPVSVRAAGQRGQTDNRVSAMIAQLPVDVADPVQRLRAVTRHTTALKESKEAVAGELVSELAEFLPTPLVTVSVRTAFAVKQRVMSTVVTNVPGPREPLYLLGRRMLAYYPYVPIADEVRIGVAIVSYDGRLFFGVTADRASVPDADVLVTGIEDGLIELVKAAEAAPPNNDIAKG